MVDPDSISRSTVEFLSLRLPHPFLPTRFALAAALGIFALPHGVDTVSHSQSRSNTRYVNGYKWPSMGLLYVTIPYLG